MKAEIWTPEPLTRARLRELDELEHDNGLPFYGIGKAAVRNADGSIAWESPWEGNAYGNEGKADVLNIYYREVAQTPDAKYLGLATNTAASLTDATVMSAITEPGAGYARQQLLHGSWSTPSDPGDGNRQISYPQLTFGPAGATWTVNYVFGTTTLSGTGGLFLFYLAAVFTISSGQSFLYTLRQKTRSV